MAKIMVTQLPELLAKDWHTVDCLAIVIDSLRFTSTACQALAAGAKSIAIEAEVADARRAAAILGPSALLCGERNCLRIEGFHLGNSPLEYTPNAVADRDLVFSTTNGTRAVVSVAPAKLVALGSMLNRSAVAEYAARLLNHHEIEQVMLVCAGTDGEIAGEDILTAGAIIEQLMETTTQRPTPGNDSTLIAHGIWQRLAQQTAATAKISSSICRFFEQTDGGKNLLAAGFQQDVLAASKLDCLLTVPARVSAGCLRFQCVDHLSS